MLKESSLKIIKDLSERYSGMDACENDIIAAVRTLKTCFSSGGKLLVCGNGGVLRTHCISSVN